MTSVLNLRRETLHISNIPSVVSRNTQCVAVRVRATPHRVCVVKIQSVLMLFPQISPNSLRPSIQFSAFSQVLLTKTSCACGGLSMAKLSFLRAYVNILERERDPRIEEAQTRLGIPRKISSALCAPSADNTFQLKCSFHVSTPKVVCVTACAAVMG